MWCRFPCSVGIETLTSLMRPKACNRAPDAKEFGPDSNTWRCGSWICLSNGHCHLEGDGGGCGHVVGYSEYWAETVAFWSGGSKPHGFHTL